MRFRQRMDCLKKSSEKIKKCKKGIDKGLTVGYNTAKQREMREKNKRKEREAVPLEKQNKAQRIAALSVNEA